MSSENREEIMLGEKEGADKDARRGGDAAEAGQRGLLGAVWWMRTFSSSGGSVWNQITDTQTEMRNKLQGNTKNCNEISEE